MMNFRISVVIFVMTLAAGGALAKTDELRQKYVGTSNCAAELQAASGFYSIRLDKTQKAYLIAYELKDRNILTIVQYEKDGDQCGTIRDVVQSRTPASSYVWECSHRVAPSDVVVGTWPANHPSVSGRATEAWRIDLKGLKFNPISDPVSCVVRGGTGSDDGLDLTDWAKKRAARSSNAKN